MSSQPKYIYLVHPYSNQLRPLFKSSKFMLIQLIFFITIFQSVLARSWLDVVDTSIYEAIIADPYYGKFTEWEPFNISSVQDKYYLFSSLSHGGSEVVPPTSDTSQSQSSSSTTEGTAVVPSTSTSSSSTITTTNMCRKDDGGGVLHTIRMYDTWGDGWDGTRMIIRVKSSSDEDLTGNENKDNDVKNDSQNTQRHYDKNNAIYSKGTNNNHRNLKVKELAFTDVTPEQQSKEEESLFSKYDVGQVRVVPFGSTTSDENKSDENNLSGSNHFNARSTNLTKNNNTSDVVQSEATFVPTEVSISATNEGAVLFNSTMAGGAISIDTPICFQVGVCYSVTVSGGLWTEEVKWDIRQVPMDDQLSSSSASESVSVPLFLPVAKGTAPITCQFSVLDPSSDKKVCPFRCKNVTSSKSDLSSQNNFSENATKEPTEIGIGDHDTNEHGDFENVVPSSPPTPSLSPSLSDFPTIGGSGSMDPNETDSPTTLEINIEIPSFSDNNTQGNNNDDTNDDLMNLIPGLSDDESSITTDSTGDGDNNQSDESLMNIIQPGESTVASSNSSYTFSGTTDNTTQIAENNANNTAVPLLNCTLTSNCTTTTSYTATPTISPALPSTSSHTPTANVSQTANVTSPVTVIATNVSSITHNGTLVPTQSPVASPVQNSSDLTVNSTLTLENTTLSAAGSTETKGGAIASTGIISNTTTYNPTPSYVPSISMWPTVSPWPTISPSPNQLSDSGFEAAGSISRPQSQSIVPTITTAPTISSSPEFSSSIIPTTTFYPTRSPYPTPSDVFNAKPIQTTNNTSNVRGGTRRRTIGKP